MKKSIAVTCFFVLCNTAGILRTAPHEITIENQSGTKQKFSLTRTNSAVVSSRTLQAGERKTFHDEGFFFKTVGTISSNNEDLIFDLTPYTNSVTIMYDGNKLKEPSYFEQTKLHVIAAQKATADRWADTKAWFSDTWKSIRERFAANIQPDIKIVNNSNMAIKCVDLLRTRTIWGHKSTSIEVAAGESATYPFTSLMYDTIVMYAVGMSASPDVIIKIQDYKKVAAQHRDEQLVIVITDINKDGQMKFNQPIWQKKDTK